MRELAPIRALTLALMACDYVYDFTTGTYEVNNIAVNNKPLHSQVTYLLKISVDRADNRIVMLEAMSSYTDDFHCLIWSFIERWNYCYEHSDQNADNTFVCIKHGSGSGRTLTYTTKKLGDNFDSNIDLFSQANTTGGGGKPSRW